MDERTAARRSRLVQIAGPVGLLAVGWWLLFGPGADSPSARATPTPPASLSIVELDEMAAEIEREVSRIDEAACDASQLVCRSVVPIVEEWTSGSVTFITFDSRDDQVIGFVDC